MQIGRGTGTFLEGTDHEAQETAEAGKAEVTGEGPDVIVEPCAPFQKLTQLAVQLVQELQKVVEQEGQEVERQQRLRQVLLAVAEGMPTPGLCRATMPVVRFRAHSRSKAVLPVVFSVRNGATP